jgi:predicted ribosomally synthesized peptide with nif11-like leader
MANELNVFFAKVSTDENLQKQLYETKELSDVASIARGLGFNLKGGDILRAQAGRILMLSPQELDVVASGEKAKTGAQWGRGGKGYLDYAGFWVNEFIQWGYNDSAFELQLEKFLIKVQNDEVLKSEFISALNYIDLASVAKKAGYDFSGATVLRYQALQILKLNNEELEIVACGAS